MVEKIAVVTGSNKGLGFGIVNLLCKRGIEVVYLTSRDEKRGLKAVEELIKNGFNPYYYQLDILSSESVQTLANHIKKEHGGLDILINNAAVLGDPRQLNYEDAKNVIDSNYKSNLTVQTYLFPLLRDNARVINISSDAGLLSNIRNEHWIQRLKNVNVTLEDVNSFVKWFLESVANNTCVLADHYDPLLIPYRVSKIALNALTGIQQREVGRGISVNSIHPGFIQTDMTFQNGILTIDEACEAPVYLALDVDQSVKGKYFWYDKSEKDWTDLDIKVENSAENLKF